MQNLQGVGVFTFHILVPSTLACPRLLAIASLQKITFIVLQPTLHPFQIDHGCAGRWPSAGGETLLSTAPGATYHGAAVLQHPSQRILPSKRQDASHRQTARWPIHHQTDRNLLQQRSPQSSEVLPVIERPGTGTTIHHHQP